MNQLNYLQELSYIYEQENVGGVAKTKAALCISNIINAIIQNDEQSESESVVENTSELDLGRYVNDIAISTLESYSTFFLDKRADGEILRGGLAEFNEIYKKTQQELKNEELYNSILSESHTEKEYSQNINYSTASYPGGDCCNQSGLLSCHEPLVVNVKHSGDAFLLNSPQQTSGVFVPNLTLDVVKGVETQFVVDTVVNGTGHPFAITGFPIGGITGPIDNGTLSMTIPIDYSGHSVISYVCTSGIACESGHILNEGGSINILDVFRATLVSVRPEFVLESGTHDYIDEKYWKSDEDIPCKYGGINEIKASFNRDVSCVDLSNFIYHATGLHGYQQYFPTSEDVDDKFQFRDLYLKNPFGDDYSANTETCTLKSIDKKRYQVLIGRKEDSMKVYNSPGDIDYGINSTKWPAERVNIYVSGRYTNLPGIHDCGDVKDVHILDKYNYKLCESSGISYRNISLVDIRSNFYAVGTAFKNDYGSIQMEYSKTLVPAFAHGVTGSTRLYLDENLNPVFLSSSAGTGIVDSVGYRARNGLTTYDGYITSLIIENREWDHNAGHAYLKTNINATQQGKGAFKVIDIDEIGRNDPEFGAIDWFMGSAVVIPGKITALAGMSFRNAPTFRCPGFSWSDNGSPPAAFFSCVGQLEDLYGDQGCSAGDVEPSFDLDDSHLTFLPNSFAAGSSISDIEPLMRIQGPFMPGGAIVESVHNNGADGCGPYIKMNINMSDNINDYPESTIFNDRKYFSYKFFNANISNGSNSVDIQYPLRSNKAVLYAYAINTPDGPITLFVAFEYYESWISLGGNRVIYPRYKIATLWPSQIYGKTGWTPSSWDREYRPVSLHAVETKRAQTCHMLQTQATNEFTPSVSERDCAGLYPYNDFNSVDCTSLRCGSYVFNDPCAACLSVHIRGTTPCLAALQT